MENDTKDIHLVHQEKLARLDAMVETAVISEVDIFSQLNEREVILIRFLNNEAFALYEPKLFEELGSSSFHGNFIASTKKASEKTEISIIIELSTPIATDPTSILIIYPIEKMSKQVAKSQTFLFDNFGPPTRFDNFC